MRFGLELALARAALIVIPPLPRKMVVWLARILGRLGYMAAGHLRRVAQANLIVAFGDDMDAATRRGVILRSFRSFALTMLDHFWFARETENRIRAWVEFHPEALASLSPGTQVCVTAHMGNWEILGMAVTVHLEPLTSVAAPLENRRLDHFLNGLRRSTGQVILSKHGAVRGLMKALRQGGKVALVLDQNTKPSAGGLFINFFGLPVPMSSAVAMLALKTNARISVGACMADERGVYQVPAVANVPMPGPSERSERAVEELTSTVAAELERLIRAHPDQWLWMYKRWKYMPPGAPEDRYPFYAKQLSPRELALWQEQQIRGEHQPESPHSSE